MLQAEYILDLQKQLTLLGGEARKDSNGTLTEESITSMAPVDKVCTFTWFPICIQAAYIGLYGGVWYHLRMKPCIALNCV
jgi:hypothetical protein